MVFANIRRDTSAVVNRITYGNKISINVIGLAQHFERLNTQHKSALLHLMMEDKK